MDSFICPCGWLPSQAQRKTIDNTAGHAWSAIFIEHLQEAHGLPKKYTWDQYHKLIEELEYGRDNK